MKKSYSLLVMLITILGACTSDDLIFNEVIHQKDKALTGTSSHVSLDKVMALTNR